jgi:aminopeptidase N
MMNYLLTKRLQKISLLLFCALFQISLFAQDRDISYMTSGGKLHPLQANMDIRHYTLILDIDIEGKAINGQTEIDLIVTNTTDTLLFDLVHLLTVTKTIVNDKEVRFVQKDDKIYVIAANGFSAGKQKVVIAYGGQPPVAVKPPWDGGFTWTKDTQGNPWVVINCQGEGGKVYYPCKDHPSDEPNEGADLKITVPVGLVVAGPGLLQSVNNANNKVTYHWKTNYTISNYCILFNIAKYKVVTRNYTTILGNVVPMQYYVLEADTGYAQHLLDLKERDSRVLEKYFGEYPWVKEKIGIAEVSNPGMEHQTMITYGDRFNYKKIGGQDYSANLFHEYAHEWWANKVTNKDWAHMWIQEGIATYAEALCYRELGGEEAYNALIAEHRRSIRNKKAMVLGDEVTEEETYSGGDIYTKGSFFMHTIRFVIGDSIFFPTLKMLATDPKYTYHNFVTSSDVEKLFSTQSKKDLRPLFDLYLRTTDVIDISVKETAYQTYFIKINNFFMPLPMDITSDRGTKRMNIPKEGITIKSSSPPIIDAMGHYMKKVMIL